MCLCHSFIFVIGLSFEVNDCSGKYALRLRRALRYFLTVHAVLPQGEHAKTFTILSSFICAYCVDLLRILRCDRVVIFCVFVISPTSLSPSIERCFCLVSKSLGVVLRTRPYEINLQSRILVRSTPSVFLALFGGFFVGTILRRLKRVYFWRLIPRPCTSAITSPEYNKGLQVICV